MIKNLTISLKSLVVQKTGNILSDMDGEKVMLSIQNGKYYNLGEIGGGIWERISESISISELISRLMSEYNVEQSVCEDQVITFLEMLLNEDLIEITD